MKASSNSRAHPLIRTHGSARTAEQEIMSADHSSIGSPNAGSENSIRFQPAIHTQFLPAIPPRPRRGGASLPRSPLPRGAPVPLVRDDSSTLGGLYRALELAASCRITGRVKSVKSRQSNSPFQKLCSCPHAQASFTQLPKRSGTGRRRVILDQTRCPCDMYSRAGFRLPRERRLHSSDLGESRRQNASPVRFALQVPCSRAR
jgi:hypothetical protein